VNGSIAADLAKGALAGAAATWVMGRVTTWMYEHESEEVRDRENRARGGKTAYGVAGEQAAALAGAELSEAERKHRASREDSHFGSDRLLRFPTLSTSRRIRTAASSVSRLPCPPSLR